VSLKVVRTSRLAGFDWSPLLFALRAEGRREAEELLGRLLAGGEEAWVWLLLGEREVLGAAVLRPEPCPDLVGAARLELLFLVPRVRGEGYGGELLVRVLKFARGRFRRVTAAAGEGEAGFLEHHGFVPFRHPCLTHFRP